MFVICPYLFVLSLVTAFEIYIVNVNMYFRWPLPIIFILVYKVFALAIFLVLSYLFFNSVLISRVWQPQQAG